MPCGPGQWRTTTRSSRAPAASPVAACPSLTAGGGCSQAEADRLQAFFKPRMDQDAAGIARGLAQTSESTQLCSALKAKQDRRIDPLIRQHHR